MMKQRILWALLTFACSLPGLRAQALDGDWKGVLQAGTQQLNLALHIGGGQVTMDSPDQGAMGIPAKVAQLGPDSVSFSIPQIGMTYAGRLSDGVLHGRFQQGMFAAALDFRRGTVTYDRPQMPAAPYGYQTEEVAYHSPSSGADIAGTLCLPVGYKRGDRVPVVLFVTGSGAENRDEEVFGHRPFLVIADYLARHGIASLRCDDRGVGGSTVGDSAKCTTADFAEDAAAGLAYLRQRTEKFGPVGLLGHSEGGSIAFMLAAKGKADFIVSMAGCGVKGDTALTAQANRIMQLRKMPTRMTVEQYVGQPRLMDNPWVRYFVGYDPTADLRAIRCPVMAINGENDSQVICDLNLPAIRRNLPANERHLIKAYPALNHLFQHSTTGLSDEYAKTAETISPEVLEDLATWINGVGK